MKGRDGFGNGDIRIKPVAGFLSIHHTRMRELISKDLQDRIISGQDHAYRVALKRVIFHRIFAFAAPHA